MREILYKMILLSMVLTLLSCGNNKTNSENAISTSEIDDRIFVSKAQFESNKMTLGNITVMQFPVSVQTTGMIDVPPENRAVVNATMGGYIKTTPLLIGDKVRKGQALVTIENPEFVTIQQEYMEVNEQLAYLQSEYERQQKMKAENITSQKSYLQAESAFKTAKARHNGLKKQLQMLNISPANVESGNIRSVVTIYAPISGSITKVNVTKGTYVSPATAILEIVNNDHIHLELSVFEKDIMKLKKGQKINFKIPESSSETYEAEVHLIGTAIEDNRTIKVHGHIKNEKEINFLPGMFVDAGIVIESAIAKALPETAIATIEDDSYLLVLHEETAEGYYFEQVEVKIGDTMNQFVSIIASDAFQKEATFLTNGTFSLVGESGGHDH
ncbi:efflux RND transporter periplasmic adaptor subunit [Winogradskyella schleiferi]|uniref:efflux RND transporter periplasmic adaptor subunit n=1 Tax=Winogradskyella schleiferi TaxID=2686078 RepID=UPI0015C00303|nr:efflux RND transporter periplasmic adaptor subunit [Winogradskyella schleiferi]